MESSLIERHQRGSALSKGNFGRLKGQRIVICVSIINPLGIPYYEYLRHSSIYYRSRGIYFKNESLLCKTPGI